MEAYEFMSLPQSQLQFINTFAPWISALGTISAVVVSLYLASRTRRPRIKLSAGVRLLIESGSQGPWPEYLRIHVVNTGDKSVRIASIGWKAGLFKKRYAFQTTLPPPNSSPLPVDLQHGQDANWVIPTTGEQGAWIASFAKDMLMPNWRSSLRTLRVQVSSSTGLVFESKVEQNFTDKLRQACQGTQHPSAES